MITLAGLENNQLTCLENLFCAGMVRTPHIYWSILSSQDSNEACTVITAILYMRAQRHSMVQRLANSRVKQENWIQYFVLKYDLVLPLLDHSTGEL